MPNPSAQPPSSNWLALKKTVSKKSDSEHSRKRRKLNDEKAVPKRAASPSLSHASSSYDVEDAEDEIDRVNGESVSNLRKMVRGDVKHSKSHREPGKYVAMDCEMVGVGLDGSESSLARVSLVNFYGAIQLDEFVKQKERVVDYRTQYSGIRPSDMAKAKPFEEVQSSVAELIKDRILVGHAIHNDLKALLLSHPRPQIRDTQYYAGKYKLTKSKFIALRNLVKQELDMTIQSGEHSSVTDARATMAVFRLHKKEWEKGSTESAVLLSGKKGKKRKREVDEESLPAGSGRKGVSSGLSTVVRRTSGSGSPGKTEWWKSLSDIAPKSKSTITKTVKART